MDTEFRFDEVGSALHGAIVRNRATTTRALFSFGATVDLTAIALAVDYEHEQILDLLIEDGRIPLGSNDRSWPKLLNSLVGAGCLTTVEWFVKQGLKVSQYDPSNLRSPLHVAAREGEMDCLQYLLSHGLDIDAQDLFGCTALQLAAAGGHTKLFEKLLEQADPRAEDVMGRNILHFVAISGSTATVDLTIETMKRTNIDLQQADKDSWTALHWAARQGDSEVIGGLLRAGLRSSKDLIHEWTPTDVAEAHRQLEACCALLGDFDFPIHSLQDLMRQRLDETVYTECSVCTLPCIFENLHRCLTCNIFTLCFKCGHRCDKLHPSHDFKLFEGQHRQLKERRELNVLERSMAFYQRARCKYRREMGLE